MKRRPKVDPMVAALRKKMGRQVNTEKIHVSVTVGKRVLAYTSVTPKTRDDFYRVKNNRSNDEEARATAFSASIINDAETKELFAEIELDGKVLTYDLGRFGRTIDYAWLRINNRTVERVYSKEGLAKLLS